MIVAIACPKHGYTKGDYCKKCADEKENKTSVLGTVNIIGDEIKSFVTPHITGKPIEINSRSQKRRLLKSHGLIEYSPNESAKNRKKSRSDDDSKVDWSEKHEEN